MARWKDLDIGFLVPRTLTPLEDGRRIMQLVHNLLPSYLPYQFGSGEPLVQRMEDYNFDNLSQFMSRILIWKSKRSTAEGFLWLECTQVSHSALYISGKSKFVDVSRAVTFLNDLCSIALPDLSYIHLYTEEELETRPYEMCSPYRQGISTQIVRKYIPDICWGTIFGPPYVDFFGRERMLSIPAYLVSEIADRVIYVQLSESLMDMKTQYGAVERTRQAVKDRLNRDAFLRMDLGVSYKYGTPIFSLQG